MSSSGDYQVAACAAGFSLGFGYLTTVRAFHQTKVNRDPWRSAYVWMIWGELLSNLCLGILSWLWLKDVVATSAVLLFFILFFYVFEVQLLMQIIINRISIISERKSTARKLKIGTAIIISCVNTAVFCIFIPSHLSPPVNMTFVHINKYWDRTSKILIMLVDAFLNWYFIHVVRARLVNYHGLRKYKPLVTYYTRLGIISVCMDLMLIGLMSLPNGIVFVQFHPVAYIVKLNIEMSMADMIVKVARTNEQDVVAGPSSHTTAFGERTQRSHKQNTINEINENTFNCELDDTTCPKLKNSAFINHSPMDEDLREDIKGIARQTEVQVYVGDSDSESRSDEHELSKPDARDFTRDRGENYPNNRASGLSDDSQIPMKDLVRPIARAV